MKTLTLIPVLIMFGIISLGATSSAFADQAEMMDDTMMKDDEIMMEDESIQTISIGNTALWIEISGDKVYVTNPKDGTISIIDTNTNKVINTIDSKVGVTVLEIVEEKNKIYATVDFQAPVLVYDLTTGESLGEIDIGKPEITQYSKADKNYGQREYVTFQTNAIGLAYNPNTELLYAVHSTVNHVNIIDTNTDKNIGYIQVEKGPLLITIDEQRNIGYVTNWESSNVSVIDLATQSVTKSLQTGFVPDQMTIDYKNNQLYVTHHASSHVTVVDLATQEITKKIQLDGPTHAIALDVNHDLIHVTYLPESGVTGPGAPGKVEFIDTNTNQVVGSIELPSNPFVINIDSEEQRLYASIINDGEIIAVDLSGDPEYDAIISQAEDVTEQPASSSGGGCLIATAAYGTELAPQVQFLREIRGNTVMSTVSGTSFMTGFNQLYYSFSPYIADIERENPMFQQAVRAFITPMISTLSIMTLADSGSEAEVLGLGISVIALNLAIYIAAPAVVARQIKKRI